MNQIATTERSTINAVAIATGANGSSIAPQSLGDVVRFAEVMCRADIALPKHLRGNAGACMAVALQALEWQMSPFAVASKSYAVNGAIAYEAQLIIAVVNTRSGIEGRLKYRFEGEGAERVCIAYGKLDGEELEARSPKFKDISPKNSPLWKSDPDQQQCYYTGRAWARRYTPEVILGVYDRDEVEQLRGSETAKDVTPSLSDRLKIAKIEQHETSRPEEGFSQSFVTSETSALSGVDDVPATNDETASQGEVGADELEAGHGDAASSAPDFVLRNLMVECLDKFLAIATNERLEVAQRRANLESAIDPWKGELPSKHDFVRACLKTADSVAKGDLGSGKARDYLMGLLP